MVGTGLKSLDGMKKPMSAVIPSGVQHYPLFVSDFVPESNTVKTAEGIEITYDYLIVAPGLKTDFSAVQGLSEALEDASSSVSTIYSEKTVEQVWRNIQSTKSGTAIFTQPAGVIKCAGAPQKVLWMALSQWKKDGVRSQIKPVFATGAPCEQSHLASVANANAVSNRQRCSPFPNTQKHSSSFVLKDRSKAYSSTT